MKLNHKNLLKIFVLFILFQALNFEEIITTFTPITILPLNTSYYYNFERGALQDERNAYFFIKFIVDWKNNIIQMKIKDENGNEKRVDDIAYESTWISYKLNNLESQKYTLEIISNHFAKMYFIDNTKEINTDLPTFLYFNFTVYDYLIQPLPLIFNIDTVQEDISYNFIEKSKDKISYGENLLEYCIIEGKECNYKGIKGSFNFEKGKKYKIILNPYKKEDTNLDYFEAFIILKELEFGFFSYKSSSPTPKIHYFLINVKNNKNIYINFNGTINYYSFLSGSEKNLFPDNIDNLKFIDYDTYALDNENETDFFTFGNI